MIIYIYIYIYINGINMEFNDLNHIYTNKMIVYRLLNNLNNNKIK